MTISEFQKHLPQILESLGVGVVIIDRHDRRILYANQKMSNIISVPAEDIQGKVCSHFICPNEECPYRDRELAEDTKVCFCLDGKGNKIPIIKTVTSLNLGERKYLLESINDNSDRVETQNKL